MLFDSQVPEAIQRMLREVRVASQDARREEFETLARYYRGGDELKGDVYQHVGEKLEHYNDRLRRFCVTNFFARAANQYINALAGGDIEVHFAEGSASDGQQQNLADILSWNEFRDYQGELAKGVIVRGGIWNNTAWDEMHQTVCLHTVLPEHVDPYVDENDPRRVGALIEQRSLIDTDDNETAQFWAWVNPGYDPSSPSGWGRLYNEHGAIIETANGANFDPNPYGVIPYTYFRGRPEPGVFEGLSYVRDAHTLQRSLMNGISDLDTTVYMQGWGQPVVKGHQEPESSVGQTVAVYVGTDGDYYFASPDAPIDQVGAHWQNRIDYMFQTNNIPIDVIRGSVAESGVALIIKWAPFLAEAEAARTRFSTSLQAMVRTVCAVGRHHGMDLPDPEALLGDKSPAVTYLWDVIPRDEEAERLQDKDDVLSGLMPKWEYIMRWRDGIDTEEQAKKYLADIEAEQPKREEKSSANRQTQLAGNLLGLGNEGEPQ